MAGFVLEADDFIFNRRAVARAARRNRARIHGGVLQAGLDRAVGFRVGIGDVASQLCLPDRLGRKRQRRRRFVSVLRLQRVVVDAAFVQPRAGAGLQPPESEPQFAQMIAQPLDGEVPRPARGIIFLADVNQTLQERPSRQNDGFRRKRLADLRFDAAYAAVLYQQAFDAALPQVEVRRSLDNALHTLPVGGLVRLNTSGADRRSLARVQNAELDPGLVDRARHFTAEGVDFAHQMALADAADSRIAGHLANVVEIEGQQQSRAAETRRGERGFYPCVAGTDHNDVVVHSDSHLLDFSRRAYFPMQKSWKTRSRMSSLLTWPVISPIWSNAVRNSTATRSSGTSRSNACSAACRLAAAFVSAP